MAWPNDRNEWYWDSAVNLHIDNHSGLVGKGHTVEELVRMVRPIPVDMIQVSALGANGVVTFPSTVAPRADLDGWDTPAVWKAVAGQLNRKFGVYINTRGLQLFKKHPNWVQCNAEGKGKGRHNGLDICMRPSPDHTGALEAMFLPLLEEICSRYQPDAIWVDGDHARTKTCYCRNCRAAWTQATGKPDPPTSPDAADWERWTRFQQERFDDYRRQMAAKIHSLAPSCLYTSNHSWRFRTKDPRNAPPWADTLSGDLSHGNALRTTRLSAMQLSPEQSLPCDIMHNFMRISGKQISVDRVLQQGALTLACGGAWFLWSPGGAIVTDDVRQRARQCAEFVHEREHALGRTRSLNPVAVLLSETSWARQRFKNENDAYGAAAAENVALSLQDARYGVDMPNEEILLKRLSAYRTIVIANQQVLAPALLERLEAYVSRGGHLLVIGSGAIGTAPDTEDAAAALLGTRRAGYVAKPVRAQLEDTWFMAPSYWHMEASEDASVLIRFENGSPMLTRKTMGSGWVATLAAAASYPDDAETMARVMRRLGDGPSVIVDGTPADRHWIFGLRRDAQDGILHITDLTSYVGERRMWPAAGNDIAVRSPESVVLRLPLPQRPERVSIVPSPSQVTSSWESGQLVLAIRNPSVHTAVRFSAPGAAPLPYHLASTDVQLPWRPRQARRLDFEDVSTREELPAQMGRAHTDECTSIRVTTRTAASGVKSLKFTDHPDAKHEFLPYLTLSADGFFTGVACMSFDLRLEGDVGARIEFRETGNAREFPVGPSVLFSGATGVTAGDNPEKLAEIPLDEWFHVDLLVPLRKNAPGELQLKTADGSTRRIAPLPPRTPDFWRCSWIGIIAEGQNHGEFYVDNLRIDRLNDGSLFESPGLPTPPQAPKPRHAPPGLAAMWTFDEGEGPVANDVSGNNHTAEMGAEWTRTDAGSAMLCSGERGSNLLVEDHPDLQFGSENFALAFQIRVDSLESPKGYRRCLEKTAWPKTWWNVDILADGRVELEMGDEDAQVGTTRSEGRVPIGIWTHVAVSVDRKAATVTYFINNILDSIRPLPPSFRGALDVKGRDLFVGGTHMNLIGAMDNVRILRRTITEKEIRSWGRR